MKIYILFSLLTCVNIFVFAQGEKKDNTIGSTSFFAEAGGPGIMFSANIDKRFKPIRTGWGARLGIGFVTADEYDPNTPYGYETRSVLSVPAQLNYIFGKDDSPSTFEVGAGATYVGKKLDIMEFYDDKRTNLFGTVSFMYRRQPLDGGFSWRIGFTPLFAQGYIQPFGGVSVGYNF
jgi:hypothetical protein